jgi:hypothetical protein
MSPERRPENQIFDSQPQNPRNNLFENIRNAASNRLAIAGIGLVAALGANGIANSQGSKAEALNIEATANGLKEDCIQAGLRMPRITRAVMKNPGSKRGKTQEIYVDARYGPMPLGCEGKFEREGEFKSQIQNPRHRKRWVSYHPWNGLYFGNEAGNGKGAESPSGHEASAYFINCNSKPKVRVLIRNRVVKDKIVKTPIEGEPGLFKETRPVVAQKIMKKPIKVRC